MTVKIKTLNNLKRLYFLNATIIEDEYWALENIALKINLIPYLKMCHYTNAASGEVSGIGKVKIVNDELAVVTNVVIFEQECSQAGTELNYNGAVDRFMVELVRKNENIPDWKLWWHSHNDFGVGWSGVDCENIVKFSQNAPLFAICINKMGEMVARIDEKGKTSDLTVAVLPTGHNSLREKCIREVKKKVKEEAINARMINNTETIFVSGKERL